MWKRIKKDVKENAAVCLIIILYVFVHLVFFQAVCPSRILFGIPCPGCGLTRSFVLMLQGHLTESIQMHPMGILLLPELILFVWERYVRAKKMVWSKYYLIGWILFCVLLYAVRMYLYFPDTPPMQYESEHLLPVPEFLWEFLHKS